MGGVIGLINVSKNIVKHDPAMLKKLEETGEKLERITYSPHFEREFAKMEKELVQTGEELIARTGPISQSMLKHPKSWVAGFAVAGAGLGVMWQSRVQQHKTEEAQQEINALKTVKGQWSEHVQQGAESELSTGR